MKDLLHAPVSTGYSGSLAENGCEDLGLIQAVVYTSSQQLPVRACDKS